MRTLWHHSTDSTSLAPQTRSGRASLLSFLVGGAASVAMMVATAAGQTTGPSFGDNWWLAGPALIAAGGLVLGGAVGLFSMFLRGERSLAVSLAIVVGVFAAAFIAGQTLGSPSPDL